jgi:hypothetical protein
VASLENDFCTGLTYCNDFGSLLLCSPFAILGLALLFAFQLVRIFKNITAICFLDVLESVQEKSHSRLRSNSNS